MQHDPRPGEWVAYDPVYDREVKLFGGFPIVLVHVDSIYKCHSGASFVGLYGDNFIFLYDKKEQYRLIWTKFDVKKGRIFNNEKELKDFLFIYAL